MFKLVVLSALLAVAVARPWTSDSSSLVYSSPIVQEQVLAKVGAVVKSIPSAVSHQSSTVVHNSAHVVEPSYTPVVETYAAAPVLKTYSAAPLTRTYAATPFAESYAGASSLPYFTGLTPIAYDSAPISYNAGW